MVPDVEVAPVEPDVGRIGGQFAGEWETGSVDDDIGNVIVPQQLDRLGE